MKEGPNPFLIQANKDDRMSKLYYEFLEGWKNAGGKLFVAFSAPRSYNWIGSWGIKEFITQDADVAPKYRGLMYFQVKNRCWWSGCTRMGGISRMSKPNYNPGASVMARRFKPDQPEAEIKSTSTTILVANARRRLAKALNLRNISAQKKRKQRQERRIRKAAMQKKEDEVFLQKAAMALLEEERREKEKEEADNPLFAF
jgi:hypothetical protein